MSEQQKILEMIEKGQITAAEGMELLEALNMTKEKEATPASEVPVQKPKQQYKFLKVKVASDNKSVNVNVNIPIRLLSTIGEIADKMTAVIPQNARKEMEANGIDLTQIDFAQIIDAVLSGTLEEPDIVDVEVWDDSNNTMIRVKIYVE
jgi:DUF4097 and DUF4098 domain-containing protein YvlB